MHIDARDMSPSKAICLVIVYTSYVIYSMSYSEIGCPTMDGTITHDLKLPPGKFHEPNDVY